MEHLATAKALVGKLKYVIDPTQMAHAHPDFEGLVREALEINEGIIASALSEAYEQGKLANCKHPDCTRYDDGREVCWACGLEVFGPYVTVPKEASPLRQDEKRSADELP